MYYRVVLCFTYVYLSIGYSDCEEDGYKDYMLSEEVPDAYDVSVRYPSIDPVRIPIEPGYTLCTNDEICSSFEFLKAMGKLLCSRLDEGRAGGPRPVCQVYEAQKTRIEKRRSTLAKVRFPLPPIHADTGTKVKALKRHVLYDDEDGFMGETRLDQQNRRPRNPLAANFFGLRGKKSDVIALPGKKNFYAIRGR